MFYQRPAFLESHMTANLGIPPGSTRPVLATAGIKAATSLNECAYKDLYIYIHRQSGELAPSEKLS